jgi:hypothetical protein
VFYFVTCFDSHYLIKGLTLYRSLVRHTSSFRLWVLCFDDLAYETLERLAPPAVVPISLRDFEKGNEELRQARLGRSGIEYYFTCTPSLPLYVLENWPEVDVITYLDADLFFFSDPVPVYEELGENSILIVGHRFPPHLRHKEDKGIYNVGLLSFRRSDDGLQCLNWWRERCIEWCYDRIENGRYADQKYLDDWPTRFRGVVVLQHKGAGLAPWNITGYCLRLNNGQVTVDLQALVFFHFHHLRQIRTWLYDTDLGRYGGRLNFILRRHVYGPYIRELLETALWVSSVIGQRYGHMDSIRGAMPSVALPDNVMCRMVRKIEHLRFLIKLLLRDQLFVVICKWVV